MTHDELASIEARSKAIDSCGMRGRAYCYDECNSDCFVENFAHTKLLLAEVKRLTRELDALKKDVASNIDGVCYICVHKNVSAYKEPCCECSAFIVRSKTSYWQWRGVQEADNGVNE